MGGGKTLNKILDALRQSLANDFPKNTGEIIEHVFSIAFYKTGNHNRYSFSKKSCISFLDKGSLLKEFDTQGRFFLLRPWDPSPP
jgi:hypothetical protein